MSITLAEAKRVAEGAIKKAEDLKIRISVAVCDPGGRLVLLHRMDGTIWGAMWGCQSKAAGATGFGAAPPEADEANLQFMVETIRNAGGGPMILPHAGGGGVAIYRKGVLIGGVGVGGGTGSEDGDCARAGVAVLGS